MTSAAVSVTDQNAETIVTHDDFFEFLERQGVSDDVQGELLKLFDVDDDGEGFPAHQVLKDVLRLTGDHQYLADTFADEYNID